ncbi:MAG: T9SS type A sorting domain-containing protein [Chitinophagales bacterium]
MIVKLDSLGDIAAKNIISGEDDLYSYGGHEYIQSGNNMLLAEAANADSEMFPGYGEEDGAIAVFDTDLNLAEIKNFGGTHPDFLYRVEADIYKNLYLLGISYSIDNDLPGNYNDGNNSDYWVMKTDSSYNAIWSRNFGGSYSLGETGGSYFEGDLILKDNMLYVFLKSLYDITLPDYDIQCGHAPDSHDAWIVAFDLTTAITDSEQILFKSYPNPVASEYIIEALNKTPQQCIVSVIDIQGRIVYRKEYENTNNFIVPMQHLPAAGYLIQIVSENKDIFHVSVLKK